MDFNSVLKVMTEFSAISDEKRILIEELARSVEPQQPAGIDVAQSYLFRAKWLKVDRLAPLDWPNAMETVSDLVERALRASQGRATPQNGPLELESAQFAIDSVLVKRELCTEWQSLKERESWFLDAAGADLLPAATFILKGGWESLVKFENEIEELQGRIQSRSDIFFDLEDRFPALDKDDIADDGLTVEDPELIYARNWFQSELFEREVEQSELDVLIDDRDVMEVTLELLSPLQVQIAKELVRRDNSIFTRPLYQRSSTWKTEVISSALESIAKTDPLDRSLRFPSRCLSSRFLGLKARLDVLRILQPPLYANAQENASWYKTAFQCADEIHRSYFGFGQASNSLGYKPEAPADFYLVWGMLREQLEKIELKAKEETDAYWCVDYLDYNTANL